MPLEKLQILSRFDTTMARFLVTALGKADPDALTHGIATAELCHWVGNHGADQEYGADTLWLAGFLHDIGKLGIPSRILDKKDKLTAAEKAEIRNHPTYGGVIVDRLFKAPHLGAVVLAHHERFDGKGYPNGLAGEDIPYMARVIAVASTYDSMRSAGWLLTRHSHQETLAELRRVAGTQLDPAVVDLFIRNEAALSVVHKSVRRLTHDEILLRI